MNRLAEFRKKKGLAQRELAEKLSVSTSTIAMWETGSRRPTLEKASEIALFFGVRIEDIFLFKKLT